MLELREVRLFVITKKFFSTFSTIFSFINFALAKVLFYPVVSVSPWCEYFRGVVWRKWWTPIFAANPAIWYHFGRLNLVINIKAMLERFEQPWLCFKRSSIWTRSIFFASFSTFYRCNNAGSLWGEFRRCITWLLTVRKVNDSFVYTFKLKTEKESFAYSKRCSKCSASTTYENYGYETLFFREDIRFIFGSLPISPKPLLQSNRQSYNKQLVKVWKRFSVFSTHNKLFCKCFRLRLWNDAFFLEDICLYQVNTDWFLTWSQTFATI